MMMDTGIALTKIKQEVDMAKKALFITLIAESGKRDELWHHWQSRLKPHLEKIDEALHIIPCFDREECDVIRLFELFENDETPDQIVRAEWFLSFFDDVKPLLKDSVVSVATPVWEK